MPRKQEPIKTIPLTQEQKQARLAIRRVASTKSGKKFLRYLMAECGYKEHSVNVNPQTGQILTDNIVYNESRRSLWVSLRKLIPKTFLNDIEMEL